MYRGDELGHPEIAPDDVRDLVNTTKATGRDGRGHRGIALFVAGSFAFGFALVPLYDVLCSITGLGNQKSLLRAVALHADTAAQSRWVTIEFVANLPTIGNWEFNPVVNSIRVHPGQLYEGDFLAHNLTGHDTTVDTESPGPRAEMIDRDDHSTRQVPVVALMCRVVRVSKRPKAVSWSRPVMEAVAVDPDTVTAPAR